MTTYTPSSETSPAPSWPALAVAGAALATILTAVGTFWDVTGNDTADTQGIAEFLPVVGIILVATAIVFGLVVRTASPATGTKRGLVLSVLAVLTLPVFWAGLPPVLAAGAVACAVIASPRGTAARVALVLAALVTVLSVVAAVAG